MHLSELTGDDIQVDTNIRDPNIAGMTANSRAVEPGYLFVALPGSHFDGRDFIEDAIARGAVAILAPPGTSLPPMKSSVPLLTTHEPRRRGFMVNSPNGPQPSPAQTARRPWHGLHNTYGKSWATRSRPWVRLE